MRKKKPMFDKALLLPLFKRMIKNANAGGSWGKCVMVVYSDGSGSLRICDGADSTRIGVKDVDFDALSDLIAKLDEYEPHSATLCSGSGSL